MLFDCTGPPAHDERARDGRMPDAKIQVPTPPQLTPILRPGAWFVCVAVAFGAHAAMAKPKSKRPATSKPATMAAATKMSLPGTLPLLAGEAAARKPGPGGVGMVLDGSKGRVIVARVVPGGPAAKAGV